MGRYPRRAIVISLLLPLLSTLVIGGIGTGILLAWHRHDTRATTVVTGRGDVISSGSGNETVRVDVWWKDATGDGREARFRVPDGREYEQSRPFAIRYDPADPDGVVFPADAAGAALIIPPAPPWWVLLPSVPFVLLTLGFGLGWLTRVRRTGWCRSCGGAWPVVSARPGRCRSGWGRCCCRSTPRSPSRAGGHPAGDGRT